MALTEELVAHGVRHVMSPVLVFDDDPRQSSEVVSVLKAQGVPSALVRRTEDALEALRQERPGVLVVPERGPEGVGGVCARAAELGVPVVVVVDDPGDLRGAAERLDGADDWVARASLGAELAVRVQRFLKGRARGATAAPTDDRRATGKARSELPTDSRFLALVIHDLRTPLNVIGLSLRMIGQSIPKGDPELEEDLRFVEENFKQIEKMLTKLSDYFRLFEPAGAVEPTLFNPSRLVEEALYRRDAKSAPGDRVRVEVEPSCPAEVALDPGKAALAIQYAVGNAAAAAKGEPVRVVLRGGPDRWVIEVIVDQPAPETVHSVALTPRAFERLCGVAAERRGMDLAIAAKVSELFDGSARLDVVETQRTAVVLDWPARLGAV